MVFVETLNLGVTMVAKGDTAKTIETNNKLATAYINDELNQLITDLQKVLTQLELTDKKQRYQTLKILYEFIEKTHKIIYLITNTWSNKTEPKTKGKTDDTP